VAVVTGAGVVKVFDLKKNKVISKYDICVGKSAFDIDWNNQGIIVGCEDGKA
jgi:hypothetical protein